MRHSRKQVTVEEAARNTIGGFFALASVFLIAWLLALGAQLLTGSPTFGGVLFFGFIFFVLCVSAQVSAHQG